MVPKSYLPNYREYYEKRWFAHGRNIAGQTIRVGGQEVPFGSDLIFAAADLAGLRVPHGDLRGLLGGDPALDSAAALAGATILTNLSASNIIIGKSDERHLLCRSQSARAVAAYVYSAAGHGESTTDLAWDGQGVIYELGDLLAESERFPLRAASSASPTSTPAASSASGCGCRPSTTRPRRAGRPQRPFRRIALRASPELRGHRARPPDPPLPLRAQPPGPSRPGLLRGLQHPGRRPAPPLRGDQRQPHGDRRLRRARLHPRADRRRQGLRPARPAAQHRSAAITMPGFATSEATKANAWKLMHALGITAEEIDIRPAALQMLRDIGHPFAAGEPVYDITFENVQAGPQDRLPVPPRQPAPRLRDRHRRSLRAGARLVHLRRRRPDEPLRGQRRACRRR